MVRPKSLPEPASPDVLAEIRSGHGLTLAQAGRLFPAARGNATGVHSSSVWKWSRRGSTGPGGEKVRLEAVRVGGRWLTSSQAIDRFVRALTGEAAPISPPRSPTTRRQQSEADAKELEAMGA